ncbi:MAG: S8 family serine peptidase [Thermoguttaceae bacterium]|nr:S8 family serine peptidase [Thermoguttaceae bacterium]MDW8079404.1 S8 family serine peptidase [Thermoguttaceae bacterium]
MSLQWGDGERAFSGLRSDAGGFPASEAHPLAATLSPTVSPVDVAWFTELLFPTYVDGVGGPTAAPAVTPVGVAADLPGPASARPADAKISPSWILSLKSEFLNGLTGVEEACRLLTLDQLGACRVVGLGQAGVLLTEWPSPAEAAAALSILATRPEVAWIEPDARVVPAVVPNDPLFGDQWALHNVGRGGLSPDVDIDAPEAWDQRVDASSVVVAIVDTGVDYRHPDLAANMWQNPREVPGNGRDDDGNGFVDDVYGYDFARGDSDPWDENGHGTHVAGIIGAVGNNGRGVTGVAWQVGLMAVKFLGSDGVGSIADAVRAINYVTLMRSHFGVNVRVINASWGTESPSQALESAVRNAGAAGILFVAAAGNGARSNDTAPHYPSNYDLPNVIAVAASDPRDQLASFSNFGRQRVHLAAPGVDILSTYPGEEYAWLSGTSMAAPFVSGTVALAYAAAPAASLADIRQALLEGVDRLPGWSALVLSGGRLNARGTLQALNFRVAGSFPGEGQRVTEPPRIFRLVFSGPVDPSTLVPGGFRVNGHPAEQFRLLGSNEVEYAFPSSPVSAEGPQLLELEAGAVRQLGSSRPVQAWQAIWYYDAVLGAVVGTEPTSDAVLAAPPRRLVLTWNEPVDGATVGVDDLLLSEGVVPAAGLESDTTIVYTLAELPADGVVEFRLVEGAVRDRHGNPMPGYSGRFTIRDPQLTRYRATDLPRSITDWQWTRSHIVVPEALVIGDLDVALTIEHTYVADLDVYLIGPDGTRILLWADVGGSGQNFVNTILDDEASLTISQGTAPFRGRFRPAEPLGRFVGRSAQGTWTLEIFDDSLFDQGQLVSWELQIRKHGQMPVQVLAITPSPHIGGEILEAVRQLEIVFSAPVTVDLTGPLPAAELVHVGQDGIWGSIDDRLFGLDILWEQTAPDRLTLLPHAGRLPPGHYQLRLAAAAVKNDVGFPLDGDSDGRPGGDWTLRFRVLPSQFYVSAGNPLPIRDLQTAVAEILVVDEFVLRDVDVFLEIEHTFVADLDVFLVAPDGTRIELVTDVGGAGDNFRRTILDDSAPVPIAEGQAPFLGRFRPETPLSQLVGKPARGLWQLHVYDDSRRDEGLLTRWGLLLEGLPLEAPRLAGVMPEVNETGALHAISAVFTQPIDIHSFSTADDVQLLRGPAGPIPVVDVSWPNPQTLRLGFPAQSLRGEYRVRLGPRIASWAGFHLDCDGDGVPGELPEDIFEVAIPLPVTLGSATYQRWAVPVGPDGVTWASVESTRAGLVTFLAEAGGDFPVRLSVYENPYAQPLWDGRGRGVVRGDVTAASAPSLWHVRIEAPPGLALLTLANVVEVVSDGLINVHGTDRADWASLRIESGIALFWNGISYQISQPVSRMNVLGYSGVDRLEVSWPEEIFLQADPFGGNVQASNGDPQGSGSFGLPGQRIGPIVAWTNWEDVYIEGRGGKASVVTMPLPRAQATVSAGRLQLTTGDYSVRLSGFKTVTVEAQGSQLTANLRGGPGEDILVARPGFAKWQSAGLAVEFRGINNLDAFAGSGGNDSAGLWGGQGDDLLTVGNSSATLVGPGYSFRVGGFAVTSFYPGNGGADLARVYDGPWDDSYTVTPGYVSFTRGPVIYRIFAFPGVTLYSDVGGVDNVRVYDSQGDESFWCSPTYFRWGGQAWEVRGTGFERVAAFSSAGGKDRATLVGSANPETLRAQGGVVRLGSGVFQLQATGFFQVAVYGMGGADRAILYDQPGDDALVATPRYTTLSGHSYELRVYDFSEVQAFSTAGGKDSARLYPEDGTTIVTLTASYGVLQGAGFFSRAWGFANVVAYAPANRTSSARLYGTEAPERLQVESGTVGLFGQGWRRYAVGYTDVSIYLQGGTNQAEVVLPHDWARLVVEGNSFQLSLPNTRLSVWGAESAQFRGRKGADHRATLAGTPAVDLLEASRDYVRLLGLESSYRVELFDFSFVEARSSGATDRRVIAEGVDYVLTTGSWVDQW